MASPLEILPGDVYHLLVADSYFTDVPIFYVREETVEGEVSKALAGHTVKGSKYGAAIQVLQPVFDVSRPNAAGPHMDPALIIRCQEIPLVNSGTNGTGKTAEMLAQRVAQIVQHYMAWCVYGSLNPAKEFITPNRNFLPRVTYDVVFQTMMPLPKLERVLMPTIVSNGLQVTITCPTAGSAIYWTKDDSLPRPTNGGVAANGFLYAGALAIDTEGLLNLPVRAAAYKAGLLGSYAHRLEIG